MLLGAVAAQAELQTVADLNKVYDYIAESEYHIRWFEEAGVIKSANRRQNLRFTYFDNGFAAEPRLLPESGEKPWEYEIVLLGYGKDPALQLTPADGPWTIRDNQASYATEKINIEYSNEQAGMRQNFLVKEKPLGNQPLELTFRVETKNLGFIVGAGAVDFAAQGGTAVAQYGDLRVFDATGEQIPAVMVRKNPTQFAILIDDANAEYPILVDPLNVSAKTYINDEAGAKFGYSIARYDWVRGSIDYPGLIVGAPYFDTGLYAAAGKVFVYYQFNTLPNSASREIEGDQANGHFGWSVATAGDVDGNLYSDVLVAAPDYDSGGYTDNGKIYLFNGSSTGVASTPSWTATVSQSYARGGYAVASVGDFNGSGYEGFAVGVPDYDYGSPGSNDGYIAVYKGSSSGPVFVTSSVGNGGSRRGFSVAPAGDVDGNGYDDFVVGAPEHNYGGTVVGAAHIFFSNGSSYSTVVDVFGQNAGDKFGFSVSGVGDVNGSGYPDILVGAPYFENGQADEGKAYLFTGTSSGLNTTAYWTVESNESNAHLGWTVAGWFERNDVNADTVPDFLICAPDDDNSGYTNNGEVRFYTGGSTPTLSTTINGGFFNNSQTGTGACLLTALYRTQAVAVGTPTGVNASDDGGTVQIWRWQP